MAIVALWVAVMGFLLWQKRSGAIPPRYEDIGFAGMLIWSSPRMVITFLTGSLFFLFRDRIRYHWLGVVLCLIAIPVACSRQTLLAFSLPILWSYVVFYWAFADFSLLRRFGRNADISYGVYLYAWPIQILIIYYFRHINPYLLSAITFFSACALGTMSWYAVERPFLRMKSLSLDLLRLPRRSSMVLSEVDQERA
jgi:peptidoglycan/LPS O-acetylase OafA/YrhL